ncbi:hypothetical protein FJ951_27690 [Mesorhizobium sp. B2-2-3]|nr:hypothetical protein FJ951_27690 [Mesorhizobium sp. B2-2-3]
MNELWDSFERQAVEWNAEETPTTLLGVLVWRSKQRSLLLSHPVRPPLKLPGEFVGEADLAEHRPDPARPGHGHGHGHGGDPALEADNFYTCKIRDRKLDMRDLRQVMCHELPRPRAARDRLTRTKSYAQIFCYRGISTIRVFW